MPRGDDVQGAVLVHSPNGHDAQQATDALEAAGIHAVRCTDLVELTSRLGDDTNAVLIVEEALASDQVQVLLNYLRQQSTWSDVPVIILTPPGSGERGSVHALEIFGPATNVTLLERPLPTVTLVAAVKVAVRARTRQRQVRDLVAERDTICT